MRVVIDSNVWISSIVFGGVPRNIFDRCIQANTEVVVSKELLSEIRQTVHRKFPQFAKDLETAVAILTPNIQTVQLGSIHIDVCRDPDDNMILETAVLGNAEIIISGDKDLLVLKQY